MNELENITPLHDRIIVRRCVAEAKTGLLVVPDSAKGRQQEGVVIAVGEGEVSKKTGKRIPMDVKVGDRVLFGYYAGDTERVGDDRDWLVMRESEVLAVILPDARPDNPDRAGIGLEGLQREAFSAKADSPIPRLDDLAEPFA